MTIKKAMGFVTDDGRMFSTLNEAAGHLFSSRLKDALQLRNTGVFGVSILLAHSREVAEILHDYNAELDRLEKDGTA